MNVGLKYVLPHWFMCSFKSLVHRLINRVHQLLGKKVPLGATVPMGTWFATLM